MPKIIITKSELLSHLCEEWRLPFPGLINEPFWDTIVETLNQKQFYPSINEIFNALNLCHPSSVKVVLLGQEPYPGNDQSDGLAFSTHKCSPIQTNTQ